MSQKQLSSKNNNNLKKQLRVGRSGVNKFENHVSIKMIHEKYPEILPGSFRFQLVSNNEVKKECALFQLCSSNNLKTMRKCLFSTSHELCKLFYSS